MKHALSWLMTIAMLLAGADPAGAAELTDDELRRVGLVDVTRAPFGADPTGQQDATAAIQAAMDQARQQKCAVFLPVGEYRVSDTLESALDTPAMRQGKDSPTLLLGSRRGPTPPKLILAPNSPGFGDPAAPKAVLRCWSKSKTSPGQSQPNINYNQLISGLDITISDGNPGAIGIHHDGAQGSGIEDVTIDVGDGHAGIVGLQAGGGGTHHVTIRGGRYGLDASQSLATAATVSGATFIGQREAAVRYNGLETLCLVGARIVVPAGNHGPAIEGVGTGPTRGSMAIVETSIEFEQASPQNVAVQTNRSLYLGQLWLRNAATAATCSDGVSLPAGADWQSIAEYAHAVQPPPLEAARGGLQLAHVNYLDGVRTAGDVIVPGPVGPPPADLQSRHIYEMPTGWGAADMVNVKLPPYNAKADDTTDDYDALQRAIDEHDVVFLGRGRYRISKTLRLRPNTVLIGLRQMSVIGPLTTPGSDFTDVANPRPLVQSADSAEGKAALIYVGIAALGEVGATLLHWQTGRNSVVRSPFGGTDNKYKLRPVKITGHGGGRWYSLFKTARLSIEGTTEPLQFYQANPEWGWQPHMLLDHAVDVTIYGLKEEGPKSLQITDCDRINVYGYGGIANAGQGQSLFLVERTPNFRLVGLVDRTFKEGTPPGQWHMLRDVPAEGAEVVTSGLERLVLYRRGYQR